MGCEEGGVQTKVFKGKTESIQLGYGVDYVQGWGKGGAGMRRSLGWAMGSLKSGRW